MPASSHSERRSSSPLAPPPAKQVPGGFSMLTATYMQPGKSTAVVMVVQGAAVGPVFAHQPDKAVILEADGTSPGPS